MADKSFNPPEHWDWDEDASEGEAGGPAIGRSQPQASTMSEASREDAWARRADGFLSKIAGRMQALNTIAVTLVLILLTQIPGCWIAVQKILECDGLTKNLYGVTVCY